MIVAKSIKTVACIMYGTLNTTRCVEFLAPLALRLYLAPVFWVAGVNKIQSFGEVVVWFDKGLNFPMPTLMAFLATVTEVFGAVMLLLGIGVRWVSIPLMIVMLVAIFTVHWSHGWQAVADAKSPFPPEAIGEIGDRLSKAREILQDHGNYQWLTEHGNFVISNNGIEWSTTYLVMLLVLFFYGAGKLSIDHLVVKIFAPK